MAQFRKEFTGDFDTLLAKIDRAVLSGSISATREESCDWVTDTSRCAVRVYERYSWFGGNRVSMTVTLFQCGEKVHLFAATTGGSQAMFFKVNTIGEESFLEVLRHALE